jgi:single-stranded DNA-binding protein
MPYLNSILLEGELSDVPAFTTTANGLDRCSFLIASGDQAPAVPVVAYGRLALRCNELLDKGSDIRIVGRIAQDLEASETDSTFRLHLVAEHVEIKAASHRHAEVA